MTVNRTNCMTVLSSEEYITEYLFSSYRVTCMDAMRSHLIKYLALGTILFADMQSEIRKIII